MRTRALAHRRPVIRDLFEEEISVDAFAGGAGAATGTKAATGKAVDIAINHDPIAIAVFQDNNPETECYRADVFSVDPVRACRGRRVRHLHASPDCRHHSRAKGGAPVSASVRALADVVITWAEAVKPRLITLENVPEFVEWGPLNAKGKPDPERRGELFRDWCSKLTRLGYVVEHRVLHAHHFGAPTSRKRLFLVARCDGEPIRWPESTHGPGKKRYRTAAECIDWSIPAPSIFERARPLADATLRRIAAGVVRFVLSEPRPFVVEVNHSGKRAPHSIDKPLTTVTAGRRGHALVAPTLIQTSYGERKGQKPRVLDLHRPLGTIVAGGQKHALVAALLAPFIVKHYGDPQRKSGGGKVIGHGVRRPLGTITARDHHSLGAVTLAPEQVASEFPNATKVLPFLTTYYGNEASIGQAVGAPLRTITTRDRFALVTVVVDGVTYAIVDIGLRMLEPHELLRAQFGPYAKGYRLDKALTKKDQVRLIGNSVVPQMQEAVLRANLGASRPTRRAA
jgi:DNA (cytosine-5)-methyltransferase 1